MCKDDVLVAVGSAQYGCGRPGGAIALRHRVEAALLNDSELVLGIVDVRNMHGSLGVDNIEEQVRALLPRMWPLVAHSCIQGFWRNKTCDQYLWTA